MTLTKENIKANYLKEKAKLESALSRKEKYDQSRTKQVFIKKPNYRKMYLEELGQSQELQKTTVQKLLEAQNRKN